MCIIPVTITKACIKFFLFLYNYIGVCSLFVKNSESKELIKCSFEIIRGLYRHLESLQKVKLNAYERKARAVLETVFIHAMELLMIFK